MDLEGKMFENVEGGQRMMDDGRRMTYSLVIGTFSFPMSLWLRLANNNNNNRITALEWRASESFGG